MNLISLSRFALVGFFASLAAIALASCSRNAKTTKPPGVDYYTCTMHPSVRSQDPNAKCPICGMDLVPVMRSSEHQSITNSVQTNASAASESAAVSVATTREFSVPVERQQQIGVTYGQIEKRPFQFSTRAVGLVAQDKRRHWDYVTRVDGYVGKLFVSSPGELVKEGEPLLTIYSPDLLTTENEFLNALKTQGDSRTNSDPVVRESSQQLVDAARRRLRLWNISAQQISELEQNRQPQDTLILKSPFQGVIQKLEADQGRRVGIGDRLVDIDDLSVVWVWAQFYENELGFLKKGLSVSLSASPYPGETFQGRISLIDPFLDPVLRTARVRIDVENPSLKLRPEMFVNVEVKVAMGEGLAVPLAAVLPTGRHNIVFVKKPEGRLEPRFVQLGSKYGDFYEVLSGVKEGEQVVTSANFLIDAEAKVQGALKSW